MNSVWSHQLIVLCSNKNKSTTYCVKLFLFSLVLSFTYYHKINKNIFVVVINDIFWFLIKCYLVSGIGNCELQMAQISTHLYIILYTVTLIYSSHKTNPSIFGPIIGILYTFSRLYINRTKIISINNLYYVIIGRYHSAGILHCLCT